MGGGYHGGAVGTRSVTPLVTPFKDPITLNPFCRSPKNADQGHSHGHSHGHGHEECHEENTGFLGFVGFLGFRVWSFGLKVWGLGFRVL